MTDLVTLEEFKEYKGLRSPESDGKLQLLVSSVSSLIENYCNRVFTTYVDADYTEWFDSNCCEVITSMFPLISVTSVKISSDGGVTQTTLTVNENYFVDIKNDRILTTYSGVPFNSYYTTPYRSLEIAYRAGYSILPADLKLAVFDLIDYYKEEKSIPSMSLGGAVKENDLPYIANSFPPQIRRVLDLYRYSP